MTAKQRDRLAMEAKAFAAWAIRNGPIENLHAQEKISQAQMKEIVKHAVDQLYLLLEFKRQKPREYRRLIDTINATTARGYDDPLSYSFSALTALLK